MRSLVPLVLSIVLLSTAQAQTFPVPITPEQPVSDVVWSEAAAAQNNPKVATNGEIALVVWLDFRDGRGAVYGSRVNADGEVLDPLGVRLIDSSYAAEWPSAVVWTGDAFLVVVGKTLIEVSPDMAFNTRTAKLSRDFHFLSASGGPGARVLYIDSTGRSYNAALVDSHGEVAAVHQVGLPAGSFLRGAVGAAADGGFLVLRTLVNTNSGGQSIVADRIDHEGVTTSDSALPFDGIYGGETFAARSDDALLVRREGRDLVAYRLDAKGVYSGRRFPISSGDANERYYYFSPALVADGERYLLAFERSPERDLVDELVAAIAGDDTVTVQRMYRWLGYGNGIALSADAGRHFVATVVARPGFASGYDIFANALPPSLVAGDPHLVSISGTLQTNVEMAAGANGYAATWAEVGPANTLRGYVRRFSASGVPQGDPLPLFTMVFNSNLYAARTKIASNGETYVIGWFTGSGFVIRRLNARTGAWIDAQPVVLGLGEADLASNGTDALAASIGGCGNGTDLCLVSVRIPMTSAAPSAPVVSIKVPVSSARVALASNGADYLAAWNDRFVCPTLCPTAPSLAYAARLRADGTAIDAAPLLLDNGKRFADAPAVAWSTDRYLVVWPDAGGLRGRTVTAQGAVLGDDSANLAIAYGYDSLTARVVGLDRKFALIVRHSALLSDIVPRSVEWTGVTFAADANLDSVASLPRTVLLRKPVDEYATLAPAARDGILGIVYDRAGIVESGGAPRAFIRLFGPSSRRRATAR